MRFSHLKRRHESPVGHPPRRPWRSDAIDSTAALGTRQLSAVQLNREKVNCDKELRLTLSKTFHKTPRI
jgi:hypothetical protein